MSEDKTQSEVIRERLRQQVNSGKDLTIKDTRKQVCKQVLADLKEQYPTLTYAHISKQVPAIIKEKTGDTSAEHKTKAGANADVELKTPSRVPAPTDPTTEQQPPALDPAAPPAPVAAHIDISAFGIPEIIASQGGDAVKIYLEMKAALEGGKQLYRKIGVRPPPRKLIDLWLVQYTLCAVKYGWKMPDWMDKATLGLMTVQVFVMPVVAKYNVLGMAKGLLGFGKKEDKTAAGGTPTTTEELAETGTI